MPESRQKRVIMTPAMKIGRTRAEGIDRAVMAVSLAHSSEVALDSKAPSTKLVSICRHGRPEKKRDRIAKANVRKRRRIAVLRKAKDEQ